VGSNGTTLSRPMIESLLVLVPVELFVFVGTGATVLVCGGVAVGTLSRDGNVSLAGLRVSIGCVSVCAVSCLGAQAITATAIATASAFLIIA
jgi:hypothetical protein